MSARVLLADDHAMVRSGLRLVLEEAGFDVVAEVGDGMDAVDRGTAADVGPAVLDVAMPRMTGLQAARADPPATGPADRDAVDARTTSSTSSRR